MRDQALEVPGVRVAGLAALVDGVFDRLADPSLDLLAEIGALQDFAPLAVDDLALLVHDVVVLDQVTAGGASMGPPPSVGAPALTRDQPGLDPHLLRGAQQVCLSPLVPPAPRAPRNASPHSPQPP